MRAALLLRPAATAAALGVLGAAALALPAAATTAPDARTDARTDARPGARINIDHVQVSDDGRVSVLLAMDALGDVPAPTAENISVTVDGVAPASVTLDEVANGDITRTTVLALDASLSMRQGGRWAAARDAAKAFLDAAPDDVRIGLVTFAGSVEEVVAPTTDHAAVAEAIDRARPTLGTNLYDAVIKAVTLAGTEGARSVLLLSDGQDEGKGAPLQLSVAAATESRTVVDVVALQQSRAHRALLTEISSASGGDVIAARSPQALRAVFTEQAESLDHQLLLGFAPPPGSPDEASVAVSVSVAGATYADEVFTALPAPAQDLQVVVPDSSAPGAPILLLGAAVLALGLAGILVVVLLGESGSSRAQRQLAVYFGAAEARHRLETTQSRLREAGTADLSMGGFRDSAVSMAGRLVRGDFETRLSQRLAGGGSALTAAEWLLIHAAIAVGAAFAGLILGGLPGMLLMLLAGLVVPWLHLRRRHRRRLAAFNAQLAETLTLMGGGLQAGLSLPQAVDTVVKEGHQPVAGEFRRALVEQRLGLAMEDALDAVADRMQSTDLRWVVLAIRIQREVGGNLAELLTTVSDTLREREYLRRQVQVLSAEGRFSAWILGGLPVALFCYMIFVRPEYAGIFFTTLPGLLMLGAAILMLVLGFVALFRLVKVKV